jgi:hypothetical protein
VEGCGTCSRPSTGFAGRAVGRIAGDRGPAGLDRRTAVGAGTGRVDGQSRLAGAGPRHVHRSVPGSWPSSGCRFRLRSARCSGRSRRWRAGAFFRRVQHPGEVPWVRRLRGLRRPGAEGSGVPWRLVGECMQPDSLRHAAVEERMPTIPVCLGGLTVRCPRWCRGGCRSTCGPAACQARPLAGSTGAHGGGCGGPWAWSMWLKVTEVSLIARGVSLRPEGCVEEHTFREGTLDREV